MDAVDNSWGGAPRGDTTSADAREVTPESVGVAGEHSRGSDLARAALRAAREKSGGRPRERNRRQPGRARRGRGWSGPDADDRDPQEFGRLVHRMVHARGWSDRLTGGQVFGRWGELVGEEIAAHSEPVELAEGVLTLRAESTAWATELRLLQRQLLRRISDGLGERVVRRIKVLGPAAPSWRHGPRHISGRGPRDTYG
nr:DciA family protein [Actinopolyspora xinjiangensis]